MGRMNKRVVLLSIIFIILVGLTLGFTAEARNSNSTYKVPLTIKIEDTLKKNFRFLLTAEEKQKYNYGEYPFPYTGDLSESSKIQLQILSSPYQQQGWPVSTGGYIISSVALVDLDNDNKLEVIVGSRDGKVYAWHADGSLVEGWPFIAGDGVSSSPSVVDLNRDGVKDVVFGSFDFKVYAIDKNGDLLPGWPQQTNGWVRTIAVSDLNGDGRSEVLAGSFDGNLYIWNSDGTSFSGWPKQLGARIGEPPALADLDGDGDMEIGIAAADPVNKVFLFNFDGTLVRGWPQPTGARPSKVLIADIDNIEGLEVLAGTTIDGKVYAWHADGSLVEGWPPLWFNDLFIMPDLIPSDLNKDGDIEISFGADDRFFYVLDNTGNLFPNWPQPIGSDIASSAAICDLDNDEDLEIVVPSMGGKLYAWHHEGVLVNGFPLPIAVDTQSSPACGDLDNDGDIEIVIGSQDGKVYAWTIPGSKYNPAKTPWKMFRHDAQRTGSKFTFDDVKTNYWAWNSVETIFDNKITSGCIANNREFLFCPNDAVNREQMAAFIIRAMQETPYNNPTPTFEDVPKSHWAYGYIERLVQLGITTGCKIKGEKKYYCPTDPVKRDQMAVFLSRAAGIEPYNNPAPTFADVKSGYWAYSYIEAIYRAGITDGCRVRNGKKYYCPGDAVKRDQMAVFLTRAFNLK